MIYPEANKLECWGPKYALVVLAARRAKQVKSGASPMIHTDSRNPITVALEEIAAGKVMHRVPDNDEPIKSIEEPEVAQLLAIPLDDDDTIDILASEPSTALAEEDLLLEDSEEIEEEPLALGVWEDDEEEVEAQPEYHAEEADVIERENENIVDIDSVDESEVVVEADVDIDIDLGDDDDVEEEFSEDE